MVVGPCVLWWRQRTASTRSHLSLTQDNVNWPLRVIHRTSPRADVACPGALSPSCFCVAFFLFPVLRTRWGDAFMLAHGIAFAIPPVQLTHSWQAPLDVFLHSQLWLLLSDRLGWTDAIPAYRLLSPLAGALYLLVALALSRGRRTGARMGYLRSIGIARVDATVFWLRRKL